MDRAVIALVFAAMGPLAFFAPKGLWIPVLIFLLARSKMLASISPRAYAPLMGRLAIFLILPLYGVLSAAWAVTPSDSVITGLKLLGYFLAAMVVVFAVDRLSDKQRHSVLSWAAVGTATAAVLVWVDLATAGGISGHVSDIPFSANFYSRGAAVTACVLVPVFAGLWRSPAGSWQRRLAVLFGVVCVVTVMLLANEAAKLAMILGMLAYGIVRWRGVLFWPVVILPLLMGLASPLIFAHTLNNTQLCSLYNAMPSAGHRLAIYEFSSRKILEKPLLGWGLDSSRSIPGGAAGIKIYACEFKGGRSQTLNIGGQLPLHPHNGSLQVWLELGAVGVALFLGQLGMLIWRLQRSTAGDGRPVIAGALTAIVLIYNISFGLWQSWLIFALIILCAIVRALPASRPRAPGDATG